jgi:signal transduction histidine kinase
MVDNLVAFSSVDEARRRHLAETFDLAAEARLRLGREIERARKRGIELVLRADEPLVVAGDRESLLLALRNVVTNAIEWSPPGSRAEVRMLAGADGIEIVVDDGGPGVPAAERARIFEPFHTGRAANGRRVGFGLGLALTDSAVRAQGGRIEVGDSPLGGARFRIVLPTR